MEERTRECRSTGSYLRDEPGQGALLSSIDKGCAEARWSSTLSLVFLGNTEAMDMCIETPRKIPEPESPALFVLFIPHIALVLTMELSLTPEVQGWSRWPGPPDYLRAGESVREAGVGPMHT